MIKTFSIAAILLTIAASSFAQPCPDVRSAPDRHASALLLANCLGDPDPKVRDALAFEGLSSLMRSGSFEQRTLADLRSRLLEQLRRPAGSAILRSFSALTLSEIARTDRVKAWMTDAEREELVDAAAGFLGSISDYRAFSNQEGFVHAASRNSISYWLRSRLRSLHAIRVSLIGQGSRTGLRALWCSWHSGSSTPMRSGQPGSKP